MATHDDANLVLRLYELRREEKMREARDWFMRNYRVQSIEDANRIAPMGSKENAYVRMIISYWEMAASFITSGVLNQELFFDSGGELLFVWERVSPVVPAYREMMKNPLAFRCLETVANAYIARMQSASPEAYPIFQAMVNTDPAAAAKA